MAVVRVALAQMNPTVGALRLNARKIADFRDRAESLGADLVVTPELALTGYPPEDLLLKEGFLADAATELATLTRAASSAQLLVGAPIVVTDPARLADARRDGRYESDSVARAGATVNALTGAVTAIKQLLPNYDVFDEQRYFAPGAAVSASLYDGRLGVLICEDVWVADGPAARLAAAGARAIVVANASPYCRGRQRERERMLAARARETGCTILYVNLVGGQDELVFDGRSVVVSPSGEVVARAAAFVEELLVVDVDLGDPDDSSTADAGSRREPIAPRVADEPGSIEEVYLALVTGTRDYITKNGFTSAVINLSGGIDSSLVTVVAVDAIGPERVRVYAQPSRYSSEHSVGDAVELASRCAISLDVISIEPAHEQLSSSLAPALGREVAGLTDENLQSRVRGVILMAISNDTGAIVLTTGNKSELATGYSTLYGDSAGGFAVIKDVPKTLVYELCRWRNDQAIARGEVPPIPESVLEKPPSAELRPGQRDDQSLPPYEVLDPILEHYVEGDMTASEMIDAGYDAELVTRIARLVDLNEYKRRQMPPGVRITRKAFGKDRRMPITNGYRSDQA